MRRRDFFSGVLMTVATIGPALTALGAAPQPQAPPPRPEGPLVVGKGDAVAVYCGGLEDLLVDPKDRGLVNALRLLGQRVSELPAETGNRKMPASALQLALDLLMRPHSLRGGVLEELLQEKDLNRPPFYAQFNFYAPKMDEAQELSTRFAALLSVMAPPGAKSGTPAPQWPGMQVIDLHGTPLFFGAHAAESPVAGLAAQAAFSLAINKFDPATSAFTVKDLPKNVSPALALNLDFNRLQPLFDKIIAEHHTDDPGAKALHQQFKAMHLFGPDAMVISGGLGYLPDRAVMTMRLSNYGKTMRQMHLAADSPLTPADLKRIPVDATCAHISRTNFKGLGQWINEQAARAHGAEGDGDEGAEAPDLGAMIEAHIGINPQRDILDHLGQTLGLYLSDTTGGGGWLSAAMFIEVKNAEALNQTIAKITAMINQMAQQHAKGYVHITDRVVNNQKMQTLTFPGVPVPIELSFTIAEGYLYAALSPQSLSAALTQAQNGKSSLADNPHFKDMGGTNLANAYKVSFCDTPRLMRDGYGIVSLAMAALNNAVRSPGDPTRGPDVAMPSYAELAQGAKASVGIQRMEGDDLVATCQCDRSLLVNVSGFVGMIGSSSGPLAMGVLLPALAKARQAAQHARQEAHER